MQSNQSESGEPMTVEECRRCGATNASGISFIRGGSLIFQCDLCGRKMHMDFLEEAHLNQIKAKEGYERAIENRDRFHRENQQKQQEEYERKIREHDESAYTSFNLGYMNIDLRDTM